MKIDFDDGSSIRFDYNPNNKSLFVTMSAIDGRKSIACSVEINEEGVQTLVKFIKSVSGNESDSVIENC